MKEYAEKQREFAKYRWEFLRRNPKYIEEWEELQEQIGDLRLPTGERPKEKDDFCMKWEILEPFCPDDNFYELVKGATGIIDIGEDSEQIPEEVRTHRALKRDSTSYMENLRVLQLLLFEEISKRPLQIHDGWVYDHFDDFGGYLNQRISDKIAETGLIKIEVDLNYSKKRLMEEFKVFIDDWKKNYDEKFKQLLEKKLSKEKEFRNLEHKKKDFEKAYKKEMKKRRVKYQPKYHFDNFDEYLQVWDLKEKEKLTWKKIATKLFPNRDIGNGVETARNYHRAARELIEKGIDLYVK